MNMRRVFAYLWVNDDAAEACDMGTIDYLDSVIESASLGDVKLQDAMIADGDDCDEISRYRNYVADWAINEIVCKGDSPMTFEEWREYCE